MNRPTIFRQRFVLCGALFFAASAPARADWQFDFGAGALYDSNLTRAANSADIRASAAATANASVGQFFAPTGNDGLTLTVNVLGSAYDRYSDLDLTAIGASAVYRHKFGLGFDAPWAAFIVVASHDDYRSDIRYGNRFALRAEVGRRFTESFDAAAGVAYDRRYASGQPVVPFLSGDVFALIGQSAYFRAAYSFNDQLQIGVNGSIRRGDVESTAQQSLPIFLASSAIAEDPAFNDPSLYAYRLRGTTSTLGATLSWALSDHCSLNLGYLYELTNAAQGLTYRSQITNASIAFSY